MTLLNVDKRILYHLSIPIMYKNSEVDINNLRYIYTIVKKKARRKRHNDKAYDELVIPGGDMTTNESKRRIQQHKQS